jgi:signal peptidase I
MSGWSRTTKIVAAVAGAVVLLAVLVVVAVTLLSVRVSGHSMDPTLADGERVFVLPGSGHEAGRFTVVVFHVAQEDAAVVKRVIAVAGDRIAIGSSASDPDDVRLQKGGSGPWYRVHVPAWTKNWHRPTNCCTSAGRSPGASATLGGSSGGPGAPTVQTVPAGKFFYLGDNPDGSEDARKFGWADVSRVQGRMSLALWPLSRLGGIGGEPTLTRSSAPK